MPPAHREMGLLPKGPSLKIELGRTTTSNVNPTTSNVNPDSCSQCSSCSVSSYILTALITAIVTAVMTAVFLYSASTSAFQALHPEEVVQH